MTYTLFTQQKSREDGFFRHEKINERIKNERIKNYRFNIAIIFMCKFFLFILQYVKIIILLYYNT